MATGTLDVALLHPHRGRVALLAAHPSSERLATQFPIAPLHPVLRLQQLHGNGHVQRLIQVQRTQSFPAARIARKAAGGGSCPSAPSEEEAAQALAQQEQTQGQGAPVAEEETTGMAKSVNRVPQIQRYGLIGFPRAEKERMDAAIPVALDTVEDCDDIGWFKTKAIKDTLRSSFYAYDPDMDLCGWTFPTSKIIKIGKTAFDPSHCCKLESTLAHEASHVSFSTESGAREIEKDCFGCS